METVSTATRVWTRDSAAAEKRDVWTAMKRGFRGRCPRCGEGKLFRAFLKVDNNCSVCGLDFTPHRADDLPAYLVIVIVGHIVVPTALMIETNYSPPVALQLAAAPMSLLALIKPQFEAPRAAIKKGIVRDAAVHQAVCDDIAAFVASLGCTDIEVFPSSIAGGDGNIEFFLGARRG